MIEIFVPATSANCSVGFDSLGLALDWNARFLFEKREDEAVEVRGCDPAFCNEDNLVVRAVRFAEDRLGLQPAFFSLTINSDIPLERGLGSSSACIVAGIAAAMALHDLDLDRNQMLEMAAIMEGHPDNVAPAIFGGVVVCLKEQTKTTPVALKHSPNWHFLSVTPSTHVSTEESRKGLPASISLQQAASQAAHALVFSQALALGKENMLFEACHDLLHEPCRSRLIPSYPLMKKLCDKAQIPMWISGSGSTMQAVSTDSEKLDQLEEALKREDPYLSIRHLEINVEGVVVRRV